MQAFNMKKHRMLITHKNININIFKSFAHLFILNIEKRLCKMMLSENTKMCIRRKNDESKAGSSSFTGNDDV